MRRLTDGLRDSETGRISSKEIWSRVRSAFAVLLSVGVLAGGGALVYQRADAAWQQFQESREDDYTGTGVADVEVEIPKGATLSEIATLLVKVDVVKTTAAFDRETEANADSKKIQAGRYALKTKMQAKLALSWLLDPAHVVREWLTLTEGQWLKTQVDQLAKATKIPKKQFESALKDWKKLGLPKWALDGQGAEGFLFPDTYELPAEPTPTNVLKIPIKQFGKVAKELDLTGHAEDLSDSENRKLTAYDLVIVASIIEREVFRAEDRPKVARVIYNRLKIGMPLGMDSTVAYAVGRAGDLALTDEQLQVDSPYNTRRFKGLPPGPISSPGKAALEAAANPEDGKWIYFVTVNPSTGETEFSADKAGFDQSRAKYKAWCAESDANRKLCSGS